MNLNVCVNCCNNKPVNFTDNRLVTEACGHVKCMDCLLLEKSGCLACSKQSKEPPRVKTDEETVSDCDSVKAEYTAECRFSVPAFITENSDRREDGTKKKIDISHIKVNTDENGRTVYTCIPCNLKNLKNRKFHARSQLAYHAYCNGQRKPYQCPDPACKNKSFATHSHFEYHMRVHKNERSYACETCGERFFRKSNLQRHKLKHTKEKKFACTKCSKAFNNMTSLRKHGLTHTDERPYVCGDCGRRFRDSSNFKKHRDKHEGKRCGRVSSAGASLQCGACPQAFRAARDLRRHLQVHTDSKPYRCKECGSNFRRKDNLERHIRNSHPHIEISSAVEINTEALKQISETNKTTVVEADVKKQLEILNPLPPLPQGVIEKHMAVEATEKTRIVHDTLDKSFIIQANNTRQTVIVEKRVVEKSPEYPYVHKIRKANAMRSVQLPPIDVEKVKKLQSTNLDIGAPPKDIEKERRYKNILLAPKLDKNS